MQLCSGLRVFVRGLEWDVVDADAVTVCPGISQQRVRLCCASGDLAGLEWDILYPLEPVALLRSDPDPRQIDSLENWRLYHMAWLVDQVPGLPTEAGRLATEPYQQVPVIRALDMVRPRLLLADGVGLGKTIQAGLIAAELLIRRRAHRILIVTPPGPLLRQWEQEMRLRFGLRFTVLADADSLREVRGRMLFGDNPFEANGLCLTSIDFAKSDQVLSEIERSHWDLVIIDEAHHCAQADTRRHLLARILAQVSDGLLLLTATPHDGSEAHFAALMKLLDPSLVDGAGHLIGNAYRRHIVRRLKAHIRDTRTGLPMFRERRVQPVRVTVEADTVRDFYKHLSDFVLPYLRAPRDAKHLTDALAFITLLKRSLSTVAACVATLHVIADRHRKQNGRTRSRERRQALRRLRRRSDRYGVLSPSEEEAAWTLEAEEMAATIHAADAVTKLADLIATGEAAIPHDPKLVTLWREVRLIRLDYPGANILIYTEYAESLRAAATSLASIGGTVLTISGTSADTDRVHAAERFSNEDDIILLSTDALAEGLNLHRRCFHLIHLDLPYNPNRLEQRNGRVDRYGQAQDPDIRYCYLAGTFEERLLLKLIQKYEAAKSCLGVMPNTLAVSSEAGGFHEPVFGGDTNDLFAGLPRLVHSLDLIGEDTANESWRDLLREIDRAFKAFEDMAVRHGWLAGGSPDSIVKPPVSALAIADFVSAALPDGRVPEAWADDLRDLPGFDKATNTVRLTNDPDLLRDEQQRGLLFPGRAHPLTRRVIGRIRCGASGKVAAAHGNKSVLATFAAETPDGGFRSVFALRQYPDGRIVTERAWFDQVEAPSEAVNWDADFAQWACGPALDEAARREADQLVAVYAAEEASRVSRHEEEMATWLKRRSTEICGYIAAPRSNDLFGGVAIAEEAISPEDRLRRYQHDTAQPETSRNAASEILSILNSRPPRASTEVRLRSLGLLLICS